jgi:hypothetical protein
MEHAKPSEFETPRSSAPLRNAAIVIYATLALLAVTIPQSLVNWLRDMNGNAFEETLIRGAEGLQNASERTGLATAYKRARDLFIAVSGADAD